MSDAILEKWLAGLGVTIEGLSLPEHGVIKISVEKEIMDGKMYHDFAALIKKAMDDNNRQDVIVVVVNKSNVDLSVLDKKMMFKLGWMRVDDAKKLLMDELEDETIMNKIGIVM